MDSNNIHEVHFDIFCPRCQYWGMSEWSEPCNSCLEEPVAYDSKQPLFFKQNPDKDSPFNIPTTMEDGENSPS